MEISLFCNEEWLMSPSNEEENDMGCNNSKSDASNSYSFLTKQDCEEAFRVFLGKEKSYMPEKGFLKLVETNDLIHKARFNVVNWLIKSRRRMNLSPGTVFIAVNYLDRFISVSKQCQGWKPWIFELLSIACLSVASKFNETTNHTLNDFQVDGLDHCFAPSLIQRMELRMLKELGWRMDSTTPFSYIHLLIQTIDASNKTLVGDLSERVTDLLLAALLDPKFLEFRPCVIAVSAVRSCVFQDSTNDDGAFLENLDAFLPEDHKDDLMKCQMKMEKLLVQEPNMLCCGNYSWIGPSSPVTVLQVECLDLYDDFPIGMNMDLRSSRKRKREELEFGL